MNLISPEFQNHESNYRTQIACGTAVLGLAALLALGGIVGVTRGQFSGAPNAFLAAIGTVSILGLSGLSLVGLSLIANGLIERENAKGSELLNTILQENGLYGSS